MKPKEQVMRVMKHADVVIAIGLAMACVAGGASAVAAQPTMQNKPQKSGHVHAHPTEGPHHGALIELGREDYHAELVHDDATNTVTIYMLDGAAKDAVAIDAKQLTVNLLVGGKPQWRGLGLYDRAIKIAKARGMESLRPMELAHIQMPKWREYAK
jgi:hypothetical protein